MMEQIIKKCVPLVLAILLLLLSVVNLYASASAAHASRYIRRVWVDSKEGEFYDIRENRVHLLTYHGWPSGGGPDPHRPGIAPKKAADGKIKGPG